MTREELRDYVDRVRNEMPYYVYSNLIDGIDELEQVPTPKKNLVVNVLKEIREEIDKKQYDYIADKDYDEGIRYGLMLAY